jgi:hypothetical protein
LAGTVNKADETAPHFSLIDDPFTIPTSDYQRKSYLLAKVCANLEIIDITIGQFFMPNAHRGPLSHSGRITGHR